MQPLLRGARMLEYIFKRRSKDKRRYTRREQVFSADWTPSTEVTPTPIMGLDASAGGVGILSQEPIAVDEFIVRFKLDDRVIPARVKKARELPGTLKGAKAYRYGLEFVGIAADDWDAVVRWSKGGSAADTGNKAHDDLQMVKMSADDTARLMPKVLQDKLLTMLVRRNRLAPLGDSAPLVKYYYGGMVQRNGFPMHRVAIVSRKADELTGGFEEYQTIFYFNEAGTKIDMRE